MNTDRSRRMVAAALSSTSATNNNTPFGIQPKPCTSTSASSTHVTNHYAQSQPSGSGMHAESITDTSYLDEFIDFSDDDSVADPLYLPDPNFNESTDFSENIASCDDTISHTSMITPHQKTQECILPVTDIIKNTGPIFIAQYPGPIFISNNAPNDSIFKNKHMIKHPMLRSLCDGKCKRQCLKFSEQDRLAIWEQYWNLKFQARRSFLNKFIQLAEIKRLKIATTSAVPSRNEIRYYHLPGKDKDLVPVCKRFFLDTLGLRTDGSITELSKALKKGQLYASLAGEKRGGKRKEINKNLLQEHILSYKPAVSHYRRHNSPFTKYLPRELTIREMYSDFKRKYPEAKCSNETYRKEIKKMKISFNMPRGDKCDECFFYLEEKKKYTDESVMPDDLKQRFALHKTKSDQALENYKIDATQKNSKHVKYFSMDLQKVILLPIMPQIKEAVFISRLITFNLTFAPINKQSPDSATCIVWHEGHAGRKTSNIVDAILTFIKNERDCQHFHIWADNCTAQNKNWTLFTALTTIVNTESAIETVTLSYLTKGHTHMTADSVHGNIERKIKRQGDVLDFEDFKDVVNSSRQNIKVIDLSYCRNWPKKKRALRKNDDEDLMKTFLLKQVVQVKFVAGSRNILYKTRFDEPFLELDFLPKNYKVIGLPEEKSVPRGIPSRKKDVIIAKLVPLMPETRRTFWYQMPVNDESIDLQTEGEMAEEI
ncbi:unnamed protein product [Diatraea saccharalis]|uniref:DUF7869 domain-containing protein n=1 Tax=Diatraea saccharalis TaxID=40085 RepID=A0A9N9RDS5_9NEOP|nr:unnamed protein product [Diatraea saccharalis]